MCKLTKGEKMKKNFEQLYHELVSDYYFDDYILLMNKVEKNNFYQNQPHLLVGFVILKEFASLNNKNRVKIEILNIFFEIRIVDV